MAFYAYALDEWTEHETLDSAKEACAVALRLAGEEARDFGEWPLWVEDIAIHKGRKGLRNQELIGDLPVVMRAGETNIRRPAGKLDDEGHDEDGEYFGSVEYYCDVGLVPA